MWWKIGHRLMLMGVWLLAVLLTGCASEEEDPNAPVPMVKAQLNFSLPTRITGVRTGQPTRMTSDVVQVHNPDDPESDYFRGIDDVHLLCFNQYPTETSDKLGGVIEMKTSGGEVTDEVTEEDYSLCQEISIPVGTTHFGFYARAADAPRTHEERMKYGVIETVGLDKNTYQGNSDIRFRPVQICTSTASLGGSSTGNKLLNLLDSLMKIKVDEAAPNDRWSTADNPYLDEAYQRMTQLTTLSSYNVQVMLGFVLKLIHQTPADDPSGPDEKSRKLIEGITEMITDCCAVDEEDQTPIVDIENGVIELDEVYQGFPDDIHLPAGAARIKWNKEKGKFEVPDKQVYSDDLEVTSVNDYVYPMNLQYQVFSDILASDKLVMFETDEESGSTEVNHYSTWQELLDEGYENADRTVSEATQSVAMVKQVNYAVGRLSIRSRIGTDNIYDAQGKYVNVTNESFTLKGYIVGGQREVDYNFQPVETSRTYAIYDTDLNGGPQLLRKSYFTEPDYILGLGTQPDQSILVALELVNNGDEFMGADGIIVKGATFYLVANMNPLDGENHSETLNRIFTKDRYTTVNITIKSLANATYGLPNLDIPRLTFGLSVNLSWGEGLFFDDTEL